MTGRLKTNRIPKIYNLFYLLFFVFIYLFFASNFRFTFLSSANNYFNYLAYSLFKKKLYLLILPPYLRDLTIYHNKAFLYWPPFPALLILPLILVFGINFSDVLYTSIFGGLNCYLFYLVLTQLKTSRLIKINRLQVIIYSIFFAFGTVHFYLSLFGRVWFTSQVLSLFPFLLSLLFVLKFYSYKKNYLLFLAGFFLGLAFLGKNIYFFSLPFYFALILLTNIKKEELTKAKRILIFLMPVVLCVLLYLFYNYLRFDNFFETGYRYHLSNPLLTKRLVQDGFFSHKNLLNNFYYFFFNPLQFSFKFPFISPDSMGNGLLFTSPLFLYLFNLKKYSHFLKNNKIKLINFGLIISIILMLMPNLFLFGTGWFQFGARYLLEVLPFMILLLIQLASSYKSLVFNLLLILSIFINIMGYFWFKSFNLY